MLLAAPKGVISYLISSQVSASTSRILHKRP